jgi:hypothetical protein
MVSTTKIVKKYGKTWVVTLSKDDRRLLGIHEVGDKVTLSNDEVCNVQVNPISSNEFSE